MTSIKISGDSTFLKKLINNFLFILEPLTQKNARTIRMDESFIFGPILSKLDFLFQTIESQTKYILYLSRTVKS